ncbi:S-adenosylmethionine decarboxylase family protein [Fibrivirga algicola]|uniref:S-adenosylmethionine decarboxylase n=1 Tax=Fibrivirga algicola TaxID=2950420 RepID=A0ABX0QDX0_9BACT|nr:S-adenosylmethionine decarboxylase [Fibrivirga algicola]ARK10680.1 S-adenosylmethionine decarboxylase [Fibrella sp. ES10-3-2-2]NID10103.1 S-adenosylmethionine decarboxylase [Fibrivirga algicola]
MNTYQPGLHVLATFEAPVDRLTDVEACRTVFDRLIIELGLTKVGEAYHSFENGGFTAVVCLTESHVSIHTWPEFGRATFDVFLSNYLRDNSEKVRLFYANTLRAFAGTELTLQTVSR